MNLFHHSAAFIAKHKRHHHLVLATLALIIAGTSVYTYRHEFAQAATFTFVQTDWSGAESATTATHTSNQTGWNKYTSDVGLVTTTANQVSLPSMGFSVSNVGTDLPTALYGHTANVMSDGRVLVGGGLDSASAARSNTYFGTVSGSNIAWGTGTVYPNTMGWHTSSILSDGRILVTGGQYGASSLASANTYLGTVSSNSIAWVASTALPAGRSSHTSNVLSDGRVLVIGGQLGTIQAVQSTIYFGTVSSNSIAWVTSASTLPAIRQGHTTSILSDGRILVTGGSAISNSSGAVGQSTAYIGTISGNTITWVTSSSLPATALYHTVNVLSDGRLLLLNGNSTTAYFGTVSGNTISWVAGNTLPVAGLVCSASSLMPDGRVLVTGGSPGRVQTYFGSIVGNNITWSSGFDLGTNSSTVVSGTGSTANVGLSYAIDGGTGADGAYSCTSGTCSLAGATYNYTTFNISSGATVNVTGTTALVIKATGNVTIGGTLNAIGSGATAVAGGYNGGTGTGTAGAGAGGGGSPSVTRAGAGGGGYGGYGGAGAVGTGTGPAGAGGASLAENESTPPMGGGGVTIYAGAAGGASGGNLKIVSSGSISIESSGVINAKGTAGSIGSAGSGGGSGGRVYLLGNTFSHNGSINVSGGAGGSGSGYGGGGGGGGGRVYTHSVGSSTGNGSILKTGGTGGSSGGGAGAAGAAGPATVTGVPTGLTYNTQGIFTSAVLSTGGKSAFTTLAYVSTLNGQTISMDVRAGSTATPDGTWTTLTNVASGGSISALTGNQYVQYIANLSTTDTTVTPTLDSVTINYSQYAASGNLTSSKYDTGVSTNTFSHVLWAASNTDVDEMVTFQVRTAASAAGLDTAAWCGPANCSGSDYFTTSNQSISNTALTDSTNDQWIQYKVFLTSGGDITPTLTSASLQYVQNGAPTVSNLSAASQSSNGTVTVNYDVTDDTNTSVTVTLQYCTTSCTPGSEVWANAIAVTGDVGTVAIGTNRSITWTPATDYGTQYKGAQEVRVMANDGEGANNLGYSSASNTFTLDTTLPAATITLDSSGEASDIVNLNISDNTTSGLQYRLCDDAALTSCDAWAAFTSGVATPVTRALVGVGGNDKVTLQAKDAYGNITTINAVGPANPTSFDFKDTSNVTTGDYREFLSWAVFTATTSSAFASYKVYHKIEGDPAFALLSTIADPAVNFYSHVVTTATSSTHYYKVVTTDTDGDISDRTTVLSDIPNGQGGSDATAPVITSAITVPSSTLKNNSAYVAFTTDEISRGTVQYRKSDGLSSWTTVPSLSYVLDHSIYLPNLSASQTYNLRVKAEDPSTNASAYTDGPDFTTVGGPVITEVTEKNKTDNSIAIEWKTSTSSDSYVYYATTVGGLSSASPRFTATQATCVSVGVCQHQIALTSLTPGTTYYYKVKSTDADGNSSTSDVDANNNPWSFTTTHDVTAPVISDIATPVVSSTAAVIVWTTDEPATSQVSYSTTLGDHTNITATDTTKSIYHVITLSSATLNTKNGATDVLLSNNALTPTTKYYYVVTSADTAENISTSDEQTVTTADTGVVTIVAVSVVNRITNPETGATPDTTPPTISNIKVDGITPFGATVTFSTSEDAVSFVDYGKDTSYGQSEGDAAFTSGHTIKLHGLTLGTDYHLRIKAIDKSGNTGTSADQTFKTTFLSENLADMTNVENIEQFQKEIENAIESILPSLVPPFISKPAVTDITEAEATITFKTNIKAFPVVGYVEDGAYDSTKDNPYTGEAADTENKSTDHTLTITGLKSNTKYHYQARAFSLPKVIGKSTDLIFITKAAKIVGSIVERKKDSFTVVWTTDEPTTSIAEFKNLKSGTSERKVDDAMKTSHSMKIENLPSGTTYALDISGVNAQGNVVEAGSTLSVTTSTDVTPPTISGFKVDNALVPGRTDRIQTIVSWITNEPSTSTVYYEEGAGTAGSTAELVNKSEVLDSFIVNHSVILANLKPGTIYRLKVTSADDSGNLGSFGPRTVITPRQVESITDIIFKNFEDSFKFLRKI